MTAGLKSHWMMALLALVVLAGCGGEPQPTGVVFAVAQADQALNEIRDDAARHAPELLGDVEVQMRQVRTSVALRRYKEAARSMSRLGPDLARMIAITKERKAAKAAAHDVAAEQWNAVADEVPRQIETLQKRIDAADKAGAPPGGLGQAKYDALKAQFETMKTTWAEADAAVTHSKATEAAAKAQEAKKMGDVLLTQLK